MSSGLVCAAMLRLADGTVFCELGPSHIGKHTAHSEGKRYWWHSMDATPRALVPRGQGLN